MGITYMNFNFGNGEKNEYGDDNFTTDYNPSSLPMGQRYRYNATRTPSL